MKNDTIRFEIGEIYDLNGVKLECFRILSRRGGAKVKIKRVDNGDIGILRFTDDDYDVSYEITETPDGKHGYLEATPK